MVGVVSALGHNLRDNLEQGYTVDLGDLGRFKLGFKGIAQPDPQLLAAKNIKKFVINYQPSKRIKNTLKGGISLEKE